MSISAAAHAAACCISRGSALNAGTSFAISRAGCPRPRAGAGAFGVAELLQVPVDHRAHREQQVAHRLGELARELGRHRAAQRVQQRDQRLQVGHAARGRRRRRGSPSRAAARPAPRRLLAPGAGLLDEPLRRGVGVVEMRAHGPRRGASSVGRRRLRQSAPPARRRRARRRRAGARRARAGGRPCAAAVHGHDELVAHLLERHVALARERHGEPHLALAVVIVKSCASPVCSSAAASSSPNSASPSRSSIAAPTTSVSK